MSLPRFRIRTLMIAVAVAAMILVVAPPWWRYWFASPWREISYREGNTEAHLFFDVRNPTHNVVIARRLRQLNAKKITYKVERFAQFPRNRERAARFPWLSLPPEPPEPE